MGTKISASAIRRINSASWTQSAADSEEKWKYEVIFETKQKFNVFAEFTLIFRSLLTNEIKLTKKKKYSYGQWNPENLRNRNKILSELWEQKEERSFQNLVH